MATFQTNVPKDNMMIFYEKVQRSTSLSPPQAFELQLTVFAPCDEAGNVLSLMMFEPILLKWLKTNRSGVPTLKEV